MIDKYLIKLCNKILYNSKDCWSRINGISVDEIK